MAVGVAEGEGAGRGRSVDACMGVGRLSSMVGVQMELESLPIEVITILEKYNTVENRAIIQGGIKTNSVKLRRAINKDLAELKDYVWSCHLYKFYKYNHNGEPAGRIRRYVIVRTCEIFAPNTRPETKVFDVLTGREVYRWSRTNTCNNTFWCLAKDKKEYDEICNSKYFLPDCKDKWQKLAEHLLVCSDSAEELGYPDVSGLLRFLSKQEFNVGSVTYPRGKKNTAFQGEQ